MQSKKKIYLISPEKIDNLNTFLSLLDGILSLFGQYIFSFQLRIKDYGYSRLYSISIKIYSLCKKYNVMFIMNDHIDLAVALNKHSHCDGVHLGKEDIKFQNKLPANLLLGISCYDNIILAIKWAKKGAQYVSFGAFFPSQTKPNAIGKPTISILHRWKEISNVPIVAIGGITANNCKLLLDSGADIIALSHYIWFNKQGSIYALQEIVQQIERT